jgi:phospholipid/cholesterol/gamma-HCH transport system substrate-binding protein
MHMTRRIWIQLIVFGVVALVAIAVMTFKFIGLPNLLFGVGHYQVRVELPEAGGLYESGQVTYRGTEVGRVKSVNLTNSGVEAVLSLKSGIDIPSDLNVEVHSVSAVGEQYLALSPRNGTSAPLKNGDVIPLADASVPPDINALLDATNRGLEAIPRDSLKTTVDEAYVAVGGLGPEISRFVKGSTALAIDARKNLDELTNVVDNVGPILDTQTNTSDSVQAWAAHLADVTTQLKNNDTAVRGVLKEGAPAADEVRQLFDRLQPTLPTLLANLVTVGDVALTYNAHIEQLLVLIPMGVSNIQATGLANENQKQDYNGVYLSFNLNLNVPPPCTTGFLPTQQQRPPSFEDYPPPPDGLVFCRVPQDSQLNVRGVRNTPCATRPGKRAPTVEMCESDREYVPLNDGYNWKGDPNATLSGQSVPYIPPGPSPQPQAGGPGPTPPPVAVAQYDPATGNYVGPDGKTYTQANLANGARQGQTLEDMMLPPK